jgi:hypothetical protein
MTFEGTISCDDYLLVPTGVTVVYDCSPKASRWVDACSSDGDGRQMNHEHRKSDGQRG